MSKLDREFLNRCIDDMYAYANGETITYENKPRQGKRRNFQESVEIQVTLKNYDTKKDKRFSGSFVLPHEPKPRMPVCLIGNEAHCDEAEKLGIPFASTETLKGFNKNKKVIKKFVKQYGAFLASDSLVKKIPRLLGPALTKAGKFPTIVANGDDLLSKVSQIRSTVKFQLKKVITMNVAVGHMGMDKSQVALNTQLAANFLASLLKKNWQNVKSLYVKTTMGPPFRIF
jgi:large subunit ribosomal protein L10Ae